MNIRESLSAIALTLQDASWHERVCIQSAIDGQAETISCAFSFWQWIPSLIAFIIPDHVAQENRETVDYFFRIFGEKRVYEISKRYDLDLEAKYRSGKNLTKWDVKQLFVGVADVRVEDISDLFEKIKTNPSEETRALSTRFQNISTIEGLTKEDYDELYKVLVPFERMEEIFLNHVPVHSFEIVPDASFEGKRHRVHYTETMRRQTQFERGVAWDVRLLKRIVHEDMATGVIIPHADGYYQHLKLIKGHGAHKLLFKPLTQAAEFLPKVVYLSTRCAMNRDGVYSRLEAFHRCIGWKGTKATYRETQRYLNDPSLGFVRQPHEKVELLGYSLGGTQAQRDACLFMDKVRKVKTLCSPGVDRLTLHEFARRLQSNPDHIRIDHIAEVDDAVSDLGDGFLGAYCDPAKVKLSHSTLVEADDPSAPINPHRAPAPSTYSEMYDKMFTESLLSSHSRETTAQAHHRVKIKNAEIATRASLERSLKTFLDPERKAWDEKRKQFSQGNNYDFVLYWRNLQPSLVR